MLVCKKNGWTMLYLRLKLALSFLLIAFLTSCGPVYKTNYTYIPPENEEGKSCIFQCDNTKLQCYQLEDMRYQRCLDRADRDYYRCEANRRYVYNYKKKRRECRHNCYCFRSSCSQTREVCDDRYRTCYQTCGGSVTSETVCVSNCEEQA